MTKTLAAILALASSFVGLGTVAQAHAASQSVMMSSQTFQNGCLTQEGLFAGGGYTFGCRIGILARSPIGGDVRGAKARRGAAESAR